jgi:hypothetical protein
VRVGMRALVVALRLAAATVVVLTVAIVAVSFTSGNAFPPRMRASSVAKAMMFLFLPRCG